MGVEGQPDALPPEVDAAEYLRLVAGDLCPCGHDEQDHALPSGEIEGEKYGDCTRCECRGMIDLA